MSKKNGFVAPHAGAWIETSNTLSIDVWQRVAPHAGAWIETATTGRHRNKIPVAPHAGAWIETRSNRSRFCPSVGRTPRGCVD